VWETYRKKTADRRKDVENQITELEGRLQEINVELSQEEGRITRLKELEGVLKTIGETLSAQKKIVEEMRRRMASITEQGKLVHTLAAQVERGQKNLADLEERLAKRKSEQETYTEAIGKEKEIEASYQSWQETRAELEKWDETAARFLEHEQRRREPLTEIETERTRLETEGNNLKQQHQILQEALAESKEHEAALKTLQAEIEQINQSIAELEKLEAEREEAIRKQAEAKAENPLLKAEMDDLKSRIDKLESTEDSVCPTCGQELTAGERKSLIKTLNAEGKEKGDVYRANQALLKEADTNVKSLEKKIAAFAQVDQQLREKTRLFDQTTAHISSVNEQTATWEADGAVLLKEIEEQLKTEKYAGEARKTLAKVNAELKKIGYDAASHDAIRKKESELRQSETDLRELENARAALAPLEREIKEIDRQIKGEQKELSIREKEHTESAAVLAVAQAEAPDATDTERKMLELQEEENKIRLEVGAAQQEVAVLETQKTRKSELESQREEHAQQVGQYKALERAFGKDGVPAMLIEQALPQIQSKANEILDRLSNGSMSVRFITQQKYKDQKREELRETLDIQISDSAGMRDYELFSGGEAFRINFAIRLALAEVLAQRAGARLQTLVIDEGFGSQDAMGRQRLVEAINLVREDFAKILVITHIDSLKDYFPTRLEVTKTVRGSVVEIV
ncbi:MAG: SMC family ATPase, partial [Anaerolineales bacterium]